MTVQELYTLTVRPLSPTDRLQLATLILGELPVAGTAPADVSDEWTVQDLADVSIASMRYADEACPYDEGDDA